jgi:hypothetical protein
MAVVTKFEIQLIISLQDLRKIPVRLTDIRVNILTLSLRSRKLVYCRIAHKLQCMYGTSMTSVEM